MSDMWNGVAPAWERHADVVDEHLRAATEVLLDAAGVTAGDDVLDLATGPGGAGLSAAARVGQAGTVVLADVAAEMVAVAARRAAAGTAAAVTTVVCDQLAIDAADASADAVIVRHGLMFAGDHVAAVREAARVLRPGGGYGAMTWGPRADNPWLGLILDAVSAQFGVPFPPPSVPGPFSLDDPDGLAAVLRDAGLADVSVRRVETPMTVASLDTWWAQVPELAGPLAAALAGMEDDVRGAIRERALEAGRGAARTVPDGIALAGCVLVAGGRRPA